MVIIMWNAFFYTPIQLTFVVTCIDSNSPTSFPLRRRHSRHGHEWPGHRWQTRDVLGGLLLGQVRRVVVEKLDQKLLIDRVWKFYPSERSRSYGISEIFGLLSLGCEELLHQEVPKLLGCSVLVFADVLWDGIGIGEWTHETGIGE